MPKQKIPLRYLPRSLSKTDKNKQLNNLNKSKKAYLNGNYISRPKLKSFKSKPSNNITRARKIYNIDKITPSRELAKKSGCSIVALKKIVNKGEGAYFSSGSRPNQSAKSWGLARLGASLTGAKSSAVDFNILDKLCSHSGIAYKMAKKTRKIHGNKYANKPTKHITI